LKSKLINLIKRAVVSLAGDDSGEFPVTQVSYMGKTSDIEVVFPYGMAANMPKDSIVLMFNVLAQEENKAGIGYRHDLRPKNLKEGEAVFGNFLVGTHIKFDEDGNIIIDGDMQLTGDLTVTGNVEISGTLSVGGTDFATHAHSGVDAGPSNTGPVV